MFSLRNQKTKFFRLLDKKIFAKKKLKRSPSKLFSKLDVNVCHFHISHLMVVGNIFVSLILR